MFEKCGLWAAFFALNQRKRARIGLKYRYFTGVLFTIALIECPPMLSDKQLTLCGLPIHFRRSDGPQWAYFLGGGVGYLLLLSAKMAGNRSAGE